MDNGHFSILVVGLGLIGGSLAKALKGFRGCTIIGVDTNEAVLAAAGRDGVIAEGFSDIAAAAPKCELAILCVRPADTLALLRTAPFRPGSLVTDVCGVKQFLQEDYAARGFRYIGGHPMAGRESGGYENSDARLFQNASYLLTPPKDASSEDVALLKEMAQYIGCRKTVVTTPEEHDRMIAYTSQLMHVVAAALCDNPLLDSAEGFSAGSLRDCTRVAKMDSRMWTELFFANKDALTARIDEFEASMDRVKSALAENDPEKLRTFLENASIRKRRYLSENSPR